MRDKPPFVALMSSAAALAADECHGLLQVCIGEESCRVSLQPQDVQKWLQLYTDHQTVALKIANLFQGNLLTMCGANSDVLASFLIGDDHLDGPVNWLDNKFWQTAFEHIELRFFFRVWMPCLLVYGESPVKLLQTVGRGGQHEWENVEKLVALDPLVVQHPRFARLLNCDDAKQRQERAAMVGECLGKSLPPLEKSQVKVMLAAYMSRVSEILGHRFKEPEIRALFDAIAKDRGKGLRDTGIPESSEAFSKAIQRYRPFWQLPGTPDKDIRDAVRALEVMLP